MKNDTEALHCMQEMSTIYALLWDDEAVQARFDVRMLHVPVLLAFETVPALSTKDLAKSLAMSPACVSRLIKELIERGLVAIRTNGNGHKNYTLTPKGQTIQKRLWFEQRKKAAHIFKRLDKNERNALLASLHTICRILG